MPAKHKVIVDACTLIYFTQIRNEIDIFVHLQSLFAQVLIPTEVKNEYEKGMAREPYRVWLLDKMRPNTGFYALCTHYDAVVKAMLDGVKGIDSREAESVAQHQHHAINAACILSDDARFKDAVTHRYPHIRVINSLHIVAMIELNGLLTDCNHLKKQLHGILKYKSAHLRAAYEYVSREYGFTKNSREISKMTSLKKILE